MEERAEEYLLLKILLSGNYKSQKTRGSAGKQYYQKIVDLLLQSPFIPGCSSTCAHTHIHIHTYVCILSAAKQFSGAVESAFALRLRCPLLLFPPQQLQHKMMMTRIFPGKRLIPHLKRQISHNSFDCEQDESEKIIIKRFCRFQLYHQ